MDAIAVTSYRQLLDEINKLPPPAEGTVRLFRGQTKDYSAILSSLGRPLRTRPSGECDATRWAPADRSGPLRGPSPHRYTRRHLPPASSHNPWKGPPPRYKRGIRSEEHT